MRRVLLLIGLSLLFISGRAQDSDLYISYPTESNIVYDICFTKFGEVLAIADHNTVRAYSASSRDLIWEFEGGHKGQILSLDISPDSTFMLSGGRDSLLVIWDFINRSKLDSLKFHDGFVNSVVFSSRPSVIASAGSDEKVVVYDFVAEKVLFEFFPGYGEISSVAFTPDGEFLACAGEKMIISVYDLQTGSRVAELSGHKSWVREVQFNSNGEKLISCGDDSRVITWNCRIPENIRQVSSKRYNLSWLLSANFHNDGTTYVVGGFNGEINFRTTHSAFVAKVSSPVTRVRFRPNVGVALSIAVATRGDGVWLIDGDKLELAD